MSRLWNVLKKSFVRSYEYLGLVLLCSVVWFGIGSSGFVAAGRVIGHGNIIARLTVTAAYYIIVMAPITAGVFLVFRKILAGEDPSPRDLLGGIREYIRPAWGLGIAQVLITFILILNIWFYLSTGLLSLKILGVAFMYLLLLCGASAIYHYPILIEQRPGAYTILKRGLLLALDNIAFTVGVFFAIILLTCLCAAALVLLPLIYMGLTGILETLALRTLFVKYGILPPEPESSTLEDPGLHVK